VKFNQSSLFGFLIDVAVASRYRLSASQWLIRFVNGGAVEALIIIERRRKTFDG